MGIQISTQKVLLWDNEQSRIVLKTEVIVRIVTNKGTVLVEAGPLYCIDGREIFEATKILRERMIASLPGVGYNLSFREDIVSGNA